MAISLAELWKGAPDEGIIDAVGKWTTLNEEAQRIVLAEVKRRGLNVPVPEIVATPTNERSAAGSADASKAAHASTGAAPPFNVKTALIIAAVIVLVLVLARLT